MIQGSEISRLLILESHPVQYHAPVYRELARLRPGKIHVAYGTDCSIRGHRDPDFGRQVAWDVPLLEGYDHTIMNAERGVPLRGARSLHGRGIPELLRKINPSAVLFTQLAYEFEWVAYAFCLARGIPIWLRTETQDMAFERGPAKTLLRSGIYRLLYTPIARFFCIGELNCRHYRAHGVPDRKLSYSRYCVPDPLGKVSQTERVARRATRRKQLGLSEQDCVVGFFGKLTPKKNPLIVVDAWLKLSPALRDHTKVVIVGDGELRPTLEAAARSAQCPVIFAGFINQRELPDFYLAVDIVVLPSRREGETWGLVVNEALLAGCAVVVSDAVGCGVEFGAMPLVRTIATENADQLALAIGELSTRPRNLDWARGEMAAYSVEMAAQGLAEAISP